MRIMKLAKYRLKAQVEKDESPEAETPKWLSVQTVSVILTHVVRWQAGVPYGHPHLSSTEANKFDGIRMTLVIQFWLFLKFLQVFTLVIRRHSIPTMHEILLCWAGAIECDGVGKCRGCPILSLSRHWSFVDTSDAFFFLFEWQVPLVGILTGRMMFRSNEISVLSLLRFYLQ